MEAPRASPRWRDPSIAIRLRVFGVNDSCKHTRHPFKTESIFQINGSSLSCLCPTPAVPRLTRRSRRRENPRFRRLTRSTAEFLPFSLETRRRSNRVRFEPRMRSERVHLSRLQILSSTYVLLPRESAETNFVHAARRVRESTGRTLIKNLTSQVNRNS